MASMLFFALTSYDDRIEDLVTKQNLRNEFLINDLDVVQKQETIIEYNIKWGTKNKSRCIYYIRNPHFYVDKRIDNRYILFFHCNDLRSNEMVF
ncbi:hypothetical protein BST94_00085 [Nonlabens xylanidelens]|nr:hypothetical protein BST94_00085 [Nonlabens xylanidelens]